MKQILIAAILLLFPSLSAATNYYVSPNGSDGATGLSPATAWASINRGDSTGVTMPGDTIWISSGTYTRTPTITLTRSGTLNAPIVYRRRGNAPCIIDMGNGGHDALKITANYLVLQSISIRSGGDGIVVQGNDCQIRECVVHDVSKVGIHVYGQNTLLLRNLIYLTGGSGIKNENSALGTAIFNSTVHGGTGDGITLTDLPVRVFNNIVVNNHKGINGRTSNICGYNNVWGNSGGDYVGGASDSAGGVSAAPGFVNAAAGRFDLLANAPEIDAGLNLGYSFNGSRPDIGACEKYNIYYVSTAGSDGSDGRSIGTAWRHLDNGNLLLRPGDSIKVQAGTYADSVVVVDSGVVDDPIVFTGTGEDCNVNGGGRFQAVRILADYVTWNGIGVSGATNANLYLAGRGICVDRAAISGSLTYGVNIVSGNHVTIQRSILFGNGASDILLGGDSALILNNTIYSSFIGIDALSSNGHHIINNIIYGSPVSGTGVRATATSRLWYDDISGFPQALQGGVVSGPGCLTADPELVDPGHGNLHCGSRSPAIDAGTDLGFPYTGPAPDMGAYETGRLADLSIIPVHTTLAADSAYQFDVSATDSSGFPASIGTLTWSHTFSTGAISPAGTFTPQLIGAGRIIVQSSIGGLADTTPVMTVVPGALRALTVLPVNATISADSTRQFSASGTDINGNSVPSLGTLTWAVLGDIGSINAGGLFSARHSDKGFVQVHSSLGVLGASDTITVVPGRTAMLDVLPSQNVLTVLTSYLYSAFAYDSDSNFIKDISDSVTWSTSDPLGSVSASGQYTAGSVPGTYYVRATYSTFKDSGQVSVTAGSALSYIRIEFADGTPVGSFSATSDNDTTRFYARGYLQDNSVIGDVVVNWRVEGADSIGSVTSTVGQSTVLRLRRVGTGRLVASHASGKTDSTGVITCQAGNPARLVVSPGSLTISADSTRAFSLASYDADGNLTATPGNVTWSVVGKIGTVNTSGLFTPSVIGTGEIVCSSAGLADTARPIHVTGGRLTRILITPDSVQISADSSRQFSVAGRDAKGNAVPPGTITWQLLSPLGSIDSTGLFESQVVGATRVIALSDVGLSDTNSTVVVVAGALAHLTILPDSVAISADDSVLFTASGVDAYGNATSEGRLSWGLTAPIGAINSLGRFVPQTAGSAQITVRDEVRGIADTNRVLIVTPGTLNHIAISPDTATLLTHDTLAFSAKGYDSKSNETSLGRLQWRVLDNIGAIDSNGVFVAQNPGIGAVTTFSNLGNVCDTTGAITIEALNVSAISLGMSLVHPGDSEIVLLAFRVDNRFTTDKQIESLTLRDASRGIGTPLQRVGNLDSISLYLDSERDSLISVSDSLLGTMACVADSIRFSFPTVTLEAGGSRTFIAAAQVSLHAKDGDSLDLMLNTSTDIHAVDGTPVVGPSVLNSPGLAAVNGMVARQIVVRKLDRSTVAPGDSLQLLFTVDIPRNGYCADSLRAFQLANAGTATESDCDSLVLFTDNGDGVWGGASGEVRLGKLIYTGESWVRSGLNAPLLNPTTRFYVAGKIAAYPTLNGTFDYEIPVNGLEVRSSNDGPIDTPVRARDTIRILSNQSLAVHGLPIAQRACIPGQSTGPILGLEIANGYAQEVTVDTVKVQFLGSDPDGASRTALDSQIDSVSIWVNHDAAIGTVSSTDSLLASAQVIAGRATFVLHNRPVSPSGGTLQLFVQASLSLRSAKNGNVIAFSLPDSTSLVLDHPVHVAGSFPVLNPSSFVINSFPASAISFHATSGANLYAGQRDQVVMDFELPRNGYASDHVRQIDLVNAAYLPDPAALSAVKLWADASGDGFTGDDPLIGQFQVQAGTWHLGNLNAPLNLPANRFFVTVSVAAAQSAGGSLQFAIPVAGLVCGSGADGPDDHSAVSPVQSLVFPSNRVTAISIPMMSESVTPGNTLNQMMSFALYNGYLGQSKTLSQLTLTNTSVSQSSSAIADHELGQVSLYFDSNRNRMLDNDLLIGSGLFRDRKLTFGTLSVPIPAESLSYFFVVADVPLDLIDGDSLSVAVAEPSDIAFLEYANLNGDLPLSSNRTLIVDGSVLAQFLQYPVSSRTLSPGDSNICLLSLRPPVNGDQPDILTALTVQNHGTADTSSLKSLQLWCDRNGNSTWDVTDSFVSSLSSVNGLWSASGMNLSTSPAPQTLLLVGAVASAAQENSSIRLEIPPMGVEFSSHNDGPRDTSIVGTASFSISNSGLRVSVGQLNPAYTVGQTVVLNVTVENRLGSVADSVIAIIARAADTTLLNLDSSSGAPVNLAPRASADMHFYFTARQPGSASCDLRAVSLASHDSSSVVETPHINIERKVTTAQIQILNSAPSAVTKGQSSIFPLSLNCLHPDTGKESASMLLASLRLHITDLAGADVPASSVFSRMVLATGYRNLTILEDVPSLATVNFVFTDPLLIASGTSQKISLLADISSSATASGFVVSIDAPSAVPFTDPNSGAAIAVSAGSAFPLRTTPTRIESPSKQVAVSGQSCVGSTTNYGQEHVEVLKIFLKHLGAAGSSQVQLTRLALKILDSTGVPIAPGQVLNGIALWRQGRSIGEVTSFSPESLSTAIALTAPVDLAAGDSDTLIVAVQVRPVSIFRGFRMEIPDSTSLTVRERNTGAMLAAVSDSTGIGANTAFPITSGWTSFRQPAYPPAICLTNVLPESVVGGQDSVPLISLSLAYPVSPDYSPLRFNQISLQVRDSLGSLVDLDRLFDRVGYRINGGPLNYLPGRIFSPGILAVKLGDTGLFIAPGSILVVQIAADVRLDAAYRGFTIGVEGPENLVAADQSDNNHHPGFSVAAGCQIPLPFTTPLTSVFLPAGRPLVAVDHGSVQLAPVGGQQIPFFQGEMTYSASSLVGEIGITGLDALLRQRTAGGLVPISPRALFTALHVQMNGTEVGMDSAFFGDSIRIVFPAPFTASRGDHVMISVTADIADTAAPGNYVLLFSDSTFIKAVDKNLLTTIYPGIEGGTYPLQAGEVSIVPADLKQSFTNYPNPFNPSRNEVTTIGYALPENATIDIELFSVTGDHVAHIAQHAPRTAGVYQSDTWSGVNDDGRMVQAGVYLCCLTARYESGRTETYRRKIAVLR